MYHILILPGEVRENAEDHIRRCVVPFMHGIVTDDPLCMDGAPL